MRKIMNSTFITLDGVIENPQDFPGSVDDESGAIHKELLFGSDAVLMGRRTYEGFAAAWPTRSGDAYSDRINSMPKYVVSSTLRNPAWHNTTVIDGDPVPAIQRLKEQPGKDISQYGFGPLSRTLVEHGLLDELRLWVHPVLFGRGGPQDLLFRNGPTVEFDLVDSRVLKNGIAILSYEPQRRTP